jgi:branched-chain amino acid transport system substrate-binding protein
VAVQAILRRGAKRVAFLHDNTAYGRGLATEVRTGLEPKGTKAVFFDGLTPGQPDYTAVLAKLKGASPDLIFFTGYYPEAGLLLRQKAEMKWAVPIMASDANHTSEVIATAGKAAAGFSVVSPILPDDLTGTSARAFLGDYQRRYNAPPVSIYAVLAGDALGVLAAAMQAAGSTEPDKIAAALRALKGYPGLSGSIAFSPRGDRVGDLYRIYRVDAAGKFVLER